MTDKTLGITLTGDPDGLLRAYRSGSAAAAQFAATTEAALGRATAAASMATAKFGQVSAPVNSARAAGQAYAAAGERFINSLERQAQAIGKTRSELLELRAAELGVSAQAAPLISRLKTQETALNTGGKALNQYGMSAAQTAAAMRGVPAQITDIAVSLQGGQQPLTVLLQQGGQLKDMFGGIAPAARALGSSLLGLINPYTLAATAAVAFGLAAYQGSHEMDALQTHLTMTGGALGRSADQVSDLASRLDRLDGVTRGGAAAALTEIAKSGKIAGDQLGLVGEVALRSNQILGRGISEVVGEFGKLADEPTKAAAELNKTYNFLTAGIYEQIRALEEQGRSQEAAKLAQETYAQVTNQRLSEVQGTLGYVERAWNAVKNAAKDSWDAMKGVGRDRTTNEVISATESNIQRYLATLESLRLSEHSTEADINRSSLPGQDKSAAREALDQLREARAAMAALQAQSAGEDFTAWAKGVNARETRDGIAAIEYVNKLYGDSASKTEKATKELAAFHEQLEVIRKQTPNSELLQPEKIAAAEKSIRDKYKDSGNQSGISAQLAGMQAQARLRQEQLRQENSRLEAERARGLLSEEQFIHRKAEAQRAALQDELDVARKQAEVAGGKKSLAERERYLGRVKEIEAQIARSHEQEAADIAKYQEKIQGALRATNLDIQNYQQTRDLQVGRQLSAMTLGSNESSLVDAINQAQDRFRRIRDGFTDKMLREGGAKALDSQQYQQGISQIDQAMRDQVARERRYMEERLAIQSSWRNGAVKAVNDWVDSSSNLMGQAQQVFSSVFSGLENVVASFVNTGKTKFSDFTRSILADMARIASRQAMLGLVTKVTGLLNLGSGAAAGTEAMASSVQEYGGDGIGALIGANGWAVPNAKGNVYQSASLSAYSNGVYTTPQVFAFAKGAGIFAEAGPEAIMPLARASDGSLGVRAEIPSWAAQAPGLSGGDINIHTSIHLADGGAGTQTQAGGQGSAAKQLGDLVADQTRAVIAREMRPGGLIYNFRTGW